MSEVITHGSLFSGIGGFEYAASQNGIKNIFSVEIDEFCQKVLQKNFPETKKYKDIKEFNGKEYEGKINIISGGFPCQPFSQAGKRKGTDDDRHLFPEMLRVISEVKPDWVIAENVYGLLNIQNGLVFEQVCSELENLEYEVQTYIIPACGKNAPHKRDRIWIIANSESFRHRGVGSKECRVQEREFLQEKQKGSKMGNKIEGCDNITSDTETERLQGWIRETRETEESRFRQNNITNRPNVTDTERRQLGKLRNESKEEGTQNGNELLGDQFGLSWLQVATNFCRMDDGLSEELYKLETSDRVARLKALGNAIVPQVAYEILKSIKKNFYA